MRIRLRDQGECCARSAGRDERNARPARCAFLWDSSGLADGARRDVENAIGNEGTAGGAAIEGSDDNACFTGKPIGAGMRFSRLFATRTLALVLWFFVSQVAPAWAGSP